MNKDRITIGRDPKCDIRIDECWDTVSNNHADIMLQDNTLIFFDHSRNGTIINNQKIQNTSVGIYPGDKIILAGVFELDWAIINSYFPAQRRPTVTRNIHGEAPNEYGRRTVQRDKNSLTGSGNSGSGRQTERFDNYRENYSGYPSQHARENKYGQANAYSQSDIDKELEKWNWGAFFWSWIWAAFHKIYWPLCIILIGLIPYAGQVCALCLCVYLGMKGSRLAWNSGKYTDFESFKRIQHNWAVAGLIFFVLSATFSAYMVYITLSML